MNIDQIVIGLGNPGPRYSFTRHNVGFLALDLLAQDHGKKFKAINTGLAKDIQAETLELELHSKKTLLLKPMTFMNLSGQSLSKLFQKFGHLRDVPITVLHDEVDLDFGRIRVKKGGGDAGHNGLKSIRAALGNGEFYRVRMGVGKPDPESGVELRDYVLMAFAKKEEDTLMRLLDFSIRTLEPLFAGELQKAQSEASKA
jgi:PTH1 family peptidyl-tRNA hydrolase